MGEEVAWLGVVDGGGAGGRYLAAGYTPGDGLVSFSVVDIAGDGSTVTGREVLGVYRWSVLVGVFDTGTVPVTEVHPTVAGWAGEWVRNRVVALDSRPGR